MTAVYIVSVGGRLVHLFRCIVLCVLWHGLPGAPKRIHLWCPPDLLADDAFYAFLHNSHNSTEISSERKENVWAESETAD